MASSLQDFQIKVEYNIYWSKFKELLSEYKKVDEEETIIAELAFIPFCWCFRHLYANVDCQWTVRVTRLV